MANVKKQSGLTLNYSTLGAALAIDYNSGDVRQGAYSGVGIATFDVQAGQGYAQNEISVKATILGNLPAVVVFDWQNALKFNVLTFDMAGAAVEARVSLTIDRLPPQ